MFSLIITLLSIGLVALLALASIYYGGDIFSSGNQKAAAAQILTESQQMRGALSAHVALVGDRASSTDDLVSSQILKAVPDGWGVIEGYAYKSVSTVDVCLAANKKLGIDLVPACTDVQYAGTAMCCSQAG